MPWMVFIQLGLPAGLLILGFTVGSLVERAHLRRLARRETELSHIALTDLRVLHVRCAADSCGLVTGEVVIASDYFKTFASGLRKIVGGELRAYESLMDRARREAVLRMKRLADDMGATHVINVRFESSSIGSMRRRGAAMVEMYAYGTAVRAANPEAS